MTEAQIIVLATPVFLGLIAIEFLVGRRRGRDTYRLHDALASIGLGIASRLVDVLVKAFGLGLYSLVHARAALFEWDAASPLAWLAALLLYDLAYYWHHRLGHRVAILWAAHVVHHQSEDYNLSTALRQTGSGWLFGWVFYLPLALLGVPPLVLAGVALIDLLYQFWVHTQQIGSLGRFDRWFCSPSNHRVHHAVNDRYVDRNYGGILMLWDHLFGSFEPEDAAEPCVYGTRTPLRSFDPLRANLAVYADLVRDARATRRWRDKLRVFLAPPSWRPADVAARDPRPAFDLRRVERFDPPLSRRAAWAASLLFLLALGATAALLWVAHTLPPALLVAAAAAVVALLWLTGAVCGAGQPHVGRRDSGSAVA